MLICTISSVARMKGYIRVVHLSKLFSLEEPFVTNCSFKATLPQGWGSPDTHSDAALENVLECRAVDVTSHDTLVRRELVDRSQRSYTTESGGRVCPKEVSWLTGWATWLRPRGQWFKSTGGL